MSRHGCPYCAHAVSLRFDEEIELGIRRTARIADVSMIIWAIPARHTGHRRAPQPMVPGPSAARSVVRLRAVNQRGHPRLVGASRAPGVRAARARARPSRSRRSVGRAHRRDGRSPHSRCGGSSVVAGRERPIHSTCRRSVAAAPPSRAADGSAIDRVCRHSDDMCSTQVVHPGADMFTGMCSTRQAVIPARSAPWPGPCPSSFRRGSPRSASSSRPALPANRSGRGRPAGHRR